MQVSKDLKQSTKKLMRQLKDNPDVFGNQKLIKDYKTVLCGLTEELMQEMANNLSFGSFKKEIDNRSEEESKFDLLKEKDRELNAEIKQINEEYKKQQDEFAKEAQESQEEIIRLKKSVNETKTDSELQRQYKKREIEGSLLCVQR